MTLILSRPPRRGNKPPKSPYMLFYVLSIGFVGALVWRGMPWQTALISVAFITAAPYIASRLPRK